jgi:hypothetical protein
LSVCLLSSQEAAVLENWKQWPRCENHRHLSRWKADDLAKAGELRFLIGPNGTPLSMAAMTPLAAAWSPQPCVGADGRQIMGLRVWGNRRSG